MREILKTANGRFYTPDEFNTALGNLNLAPQLSCTHLNIPSLPYHYLEQHNLLYNLEVKPNIIGISETRLQGGTNQLPIFLFQTKFTNIT